MDRRIFLLGLAGVLSPPALALAQGGLPGHWQVVGRCALSRSDRTTGLDSSAPSGCRALRLDLVAGGSQPGPEGVTLMRLDRLKVHYDPGGAISLPEPRLLSSGLPGLPIHLPATDRRVVRLDLSWDPIRPVTGAPDAPGARHPVDPVHLQVLALVT